MLITRKRVVLVAAAVPLLAAGVVVANQTDGTNARDSGGEATGSYDRVRTTSATVDIPSVAGPQRQPNIVVIMADDMREDDLRYMPKTMQTIAARGVHFKNSFSPFPLCCPARASFLTGEYTHNHKVWSVADPYGFQALDDSATVPVWLQDVGYNTVFLGKYLNGYGRQPMPNGSPSRDYVPPGWSDWRGSIDGSGDGGTYRYFDTTLNINGEAVGNEGRYQTRLYGDHSVRIVEQYAASQRPFFLWASYVAPHHGAPNEPGDPKPVLRSDGKLQTFKTPARPDDVQGTLDDQVRHAPGAEGEADVSDKPFFIRGLPALSKAEHKALLNITRQRAEAISALDDQVARTVRALKRTGELDNTIVVVTSDNGYFLGEHRMRQGKSLPYEPSLRVPMLIRGPQIPRGQVRNDPFLTIDHAPTFLAAAGAPTQDQLNGSNMLPGTRRGDRGWTRGVLTDTGPRLVASNASESDNWLVEGRGPKVTRFSTGVRTARYLYVDHGGRGKELYDLRHDPQELQNLAGRSDMAQIQRRLARVLDRMRDCVGTDCTAPLPKPLQRY